MSIHDQTGKSCQVFEKGKTGKQWRTSTVQSKHIVLIYLVLKTSLETLKSDNKLLAEKNNFILSSLQVT